MERRDFIRGAALGAGATAISTLATPAIAQGAKDMTIVSTWPRDFPGLGISAQRLAARIEELTAGEIRVQYFAAGERVGAFDAFDHVASGSAQAYTAAPVYWKGKHQAFVPFGTIPFGLTYTEMDAWMKFKGGQELYDELTAEFGLKGFPYGNTGVQMGGWYNKEINSPGDFKGLKIRIPGDGGDVLSRLGASVVSLPGGQIYENLISGTIDAAEWVGPYNDYFMKFYEAAKYYYWPGMFEPGAQLNMAMNKAWWESLSETHQAVIEAACNEEHAQSMAETNANNGEYMRKLIDEHGVKLRQFNGEVIDALAGAAQEVFETARDHSDLAKRVYDSVAAARSEVGAWMKLSDVGFSTNRNSALGIGEDAGGATGIAAGGACPPEVEALADAVRSLVGQ